MQVTTFQQVEHTYISTLLKLLQTQSSIPYTHVVVNTCRKDLDISKRASAT